ncbi:MAG: acyltransferase family protein [Promethearchaeota archaeon]|jgi:uncharacterized membrane protein
MKSQRLKSIDIFRGLCMAWMVLAHLIDWWLKPEYDWLHSITVKILDPIGASGFLFISGVSIALSFRSRLERTKSNEQYNQRIIRNSYLLRASFIFIIALSYNSSIALVLNDPSMIWTWFVLLTAAISLFLAWPLLKTTKFLRICIAISLIIGQQFIVSWLLPFQGDSNIFGFLFHFLYNIIHQDPILVFFPFFLVGTVIGDVIFARFSLKNKDDLPINLKKRELLFLVIIGILLIILGIFFNYPLFLKRQNLSWIIYSLGINILLLTTFLLVEENNLFKTKKSYKMIFYYSYYSLTIYLAHNLLYLLFLNKLNVINIWFLSIAAFFFIGFILRGVYKIWGKRFSIKVQVGRLSLKIAMKLEKRLNKKENMINY